MFGVSQLVWRGFHALDAAEVPAEVTPGGVILFGRNLDPDPVEGPRRCHALVWDLQERWGGELPLAVAIDQEGGPVSRLKPWVGETPSFRQVWTTRGAEGACAWGALWGEGLRLLGFNVDFAPVADRYDGIPGTGLGERCASGDPAAVAEAVGAFLEGLEGQGVQGCLKHFPGLGGTRVDSHKEMPVLEDPENVLQNLEPFRSLARPNRLIMVGHVRTPWSEGLPASLHRGHVAGNPWGVQGAWITDDMDMGGCAGWSWPERVRLAVEAGHQTLLVCQEQASVDQALAALRALPEETTAGPLAGAWAFRATLPVRQRDAFDPSAWQDWVARVRRASMP